MKQRPWMKLVERVVHDAYGRLRGVPPMRSEVENLGDETTVILEAGTASVSLEDESEFYKVDFPPSITSWTLKHCHTLHDAYVVGDQGHVFQRSGEFINVCPSFERLDPKKIRRPIPGLAQRLERPVFHLTGRDHENHGHFLMQHLPRLMAARSFLAKKGIQPDILVPTGHEKWQARYLGTLGYGADRVVPCRKGTLSAKKLYYVPMLWHGGALGPPHLYGEMQECFRAFAEVSDMALPTGRPIFVTREDAPSRRLSNEAEIIQICRRQFGDVDVMNLRQVPFAEQIRRFAAAPLVIGPQGQGLTNIIFSRHTRLLILEAGQSAREAGWANVYRDFAHMTGNSALRILSGTPWPNDGDWAFPSAAFSEQLQRVVSLGLHLHRAPVLR